MTALVLGCVGCGTATALDMKSVKVVVQPPSNVALHLKVTPPEGQTATLLATDFAVYEDGKQIPNKKVRRALLPSSLAVERYVVVAIDLSGPLVDSEYLSTLQDVVASFTERVGKDTRVALAVFDGDGLKPFIGFDVVDFKPGLTAMRKFRPHNRTVDLWGAFIASLDALDAAAKESTAPEHSSTLVFMTDRRDKAGKHTLDEANTRLQASPADVYVLGLGDAINREELTRLGRPDAFFVERSRQALRRSRHPDRGQARPGLRVLVLLRGQARQEAHQAHGRAARLDQAVERRGRAILLVEVLREGRLRPAAKAELRRPRRRGRQGRGRWRRGVRRREAEQEEEVQAGRGAGGRGRDTGRELTARTDSAN